MRKMAGSSSADRISRLPNNVRKQILMFLPLNEAANSSFLSTKWSHLWTNLPSLVIHQSFLDAITARRSEANEEELVLLEVCRLLILHGETLKNLSFSLDKWKNQVDQHLQLLPYSTLESLNIVYGGYCHLSKTVFTSFSQLKTLRLFCCMFTFSSVSFEGFDKLTVLELRSVLLVGTQPHFTFRCPLLQTLILDSCVGCLPYPRVVVEEAPMLECFHLVGYFSHFEFRDCPLLKNVVLRETNSRVLNVSGVTFVTVESLSIGNICKLVIPMKPWAKLRQLSLDEVNLSSRGRVSYVVGMIMNSPNLQRVAIQMAERSGLEHVDENSDDEAEIGDDDASEYEESRLLRKVEVQRIRGTVHEMNLLRWLLISSPALDEMQIELSSALSDARKLSAVIEFNRLRRASSKAQIIVN